MNNSDPQWPPSAHLAGLQYKYFSTVGQILDLPVKKAMGFVRHEKGKRFQEECKPYVTGEARVGYVSLGVLNGGGPHARLTHTFGVSWDKVCFANNRFIVSVVAQEGSRFLPKGQTIEQVLRTCSYLMNPTPVSMDECTHVEVMLTDARAMRAVSVDSIGLNPHFHERLKHFAWCKHWDKEWERQIVASFVPCEEVQQMLDDLHDVMDP